MQATRKGRRGTPRSLVLDIHYGRTMARALLRVAAIDPGRAGEIRILLSHAEAAHKRVRRLLAQHRLIRRRASVPRILQLPSPRQGGCDAA